MLLKLLKKDPDERFQSAGELHEVLEQYLAYLHQPDVSNPPMITKPETSKIFSVALRVLLLCVVLVASLIGAYGGGWLELPESQQSAPAEGAENAEVNVRRAKEEARAAEAAGQISAESARHTAAGLKIQRELDGDTTRDGTRISVPVPGTPPSAPTPPSPPEPTSESKASSNSIIIGLFDWFLRILDTDSASGESDGLIIE